jgi:hypothetical protein
VLPDKVLAKAALGPGPVTRSRPSRPTLGRAVCRATPLPLASGIEHPKIPAPGVRLQGPGLTFRDLSHVGVRAPSTGYYPKRMEPILSWVFISLGCSPFLPRPHRIVWPPLAHFARGFAEAAPYAGASEYQ